MGHYLSDLAPRGLAEEIAIEEGLKRKREEEKAVRGRIRDARAIELRQKYSGEELPQDAVRERITTLHLRLQKITSAIPAPVTLHLPDGEDTWDVSAKDDPEKGLRVLLERQDVQFREDEVYILDIVQGEADVRHHERGQLEINVGRNSERELAPAEELFDRLVTPLEVAMGITPAEVDVFKAE